MSLLLVLGEMSLADCPIEHYPSADFDHDGDVDLYDFYVFQHYFGKGLIE